MMSCWRESPKNRPTFTELCKSLEVLLEDVSQYLQIETIEQPKNYDFKINKCQSSCSTERYIQPVTPLIRGISN